MLVPNQVVSRSGFGVNGRVETQARENERERARMSEGGEVR